MNNYDVLVACAMNHFKTERILNYGKLVRFINENSPKVFEKKLSESEFDKAFRLTLVALFN